MYNGQLELSFEAANTVAKPRAFHGRPTRAQWWFQRMRQLVDNATDWLPAPPPRPEQTCFPGSYRQPTDQRQLCE